VNSVTEDDWGFDADFARTAAPLLDALYTTWWRVRADGLEHVPAAGPALVVANQAGGQPWDAAMLATALRRRDVRPDDPARFLVHGRPFELPFVSTALRRLGGVAPPREFVLMDRAAIGLGAVFLRLEAEINWHRLFHDLIGDFDEATLARRQAAALKAVGLTPPA